MTGSSTQIPLKNLGGNCVLSLPLQHGRKRLRLLQGTAAALPRNGGPRNSTVLSILLALAGTEMRLGEAMALQWSDVNVELRDQSGTGIFGKEVSYAKVSAWPYRRYV
jgi:hypothetical protein